MKRAAVVGMFAVYFAVAFVGCASRSPWPSVANVCRQHGGPLTAEVIAKNAVLVQCQDGMHFLVGEP